MWYIDDLFLQIAIIRDKIKGFPHKNQWHLQVKTTKVKTG